MEPMVTEAYIEERLKEDGLSFNKIYFEKDGEQFVYQVVHNLPLFDFSIEAAFESWAAHTHHHSVDAFCNYIAGKHEDLFCVTLDDYIQLITSVR